MRIDRKEYVHTCKNTGREDRNMTYIKILVKVFEKFSSQSIVATECPYLSHTAAHSRDGVLLAACAFRNYS